MKAFTIFIIALFFFSPFSSVNSQSKISLKRIPQLSLSVTLGYEYAFSNANGNVNGFSTFRDVVNNQSIFIAKDYGMQHGGNIQVSAKYGMDRSRRLRLTSDLGYTLFYNSEDNGRNRTKWSIFSLGAGVEYYLRTSGSSLPFVNFGIDYNLIFGGWQTDVTFPDNTMSNIYIKFRPQSRLGISLGSGADFKINSKTSFIMGIKGVWANIAPKNTGTTASGYEAYINDASNSNGIEIGNSKQIIYMQLYSGLSIRLF